MKSTKTNPLSELGLDELRDVLRFCTVLHKLNLKEIDDIENKVHDEITDNYCSECEYSIDNCDCRYYDYDRDYTIDEDAQYDAWKDQQIMDED